jgi:proline dehydrogenase
VLASGLDRFLRALLLGAAESGRVRAFVRRYGLQLGAARFVAGETIDDCVPVLRSLNARGLHANTTILGEQIVDRRATLALAREYELILDRIHAEGLRCNIAVKLTQLGLVLDEELAFDNVASLVDHASALGNSIRIDMEQSEHVDATIRIYRRLRGTGRAAVGCALQAYLHRTEKDLLALLPLQPSVRLVKGAYLEPPTEAHARKTDVDASYARLLELAIGGGAYTAVATHDDRLIEHALRIADRHGVRTDGFEFQMLYGVRPQRQLELARDGFKMLVATPFGRHWYPYLMRRLAERPANLAFAIRSLARR